MSEADLSDGAWLLLKLLRDAGPRSLTFLMISAMTEMGQLMSTHPELVKEKVRHLCAMGGLQKNADGEWEPDTAVNNMWDIDNAKLMYAFCFKHAIPMSVISRNAVPNLPMQLAKDYAGKEPNNAILQYLVNAQQLGLIGLWQSLCSGKLPARCTKRWFFQTFCGVKEEEKLGSLEETTNASTDIAIHLNGSVKPYDVCALMLAIPDARRTFNLQPNRESAGDATHALYLHADNMLDLKEVESLLKFTFKEIGALGQKSKRSGRGSEW